MIDSALFAQQEARRRAMLGAMQIEVWLPRQALPFAAASNPQLLAFTAEPQLKQDQGTADAPEVKINVEPARESAALGQLLQQLKAGAAPETSASTGLVQAEEVAESEPASSLEPTAIPHFNLQLLRADNCLFLVDLRVAEGYQQSDPDYRLLRDLLRAAGITQAPTVERAGAPIQWPMLQAGLLAADQGAETALQTVQYLLQLELHKQPAQCVWLIGRSAMRFAAGLDETAYYSAQQHPVLGSVWAIPSLELLIEQPERKAEVWRSMQANWQLWRN